VLFEQRRERFRHVLSRSRFVLCPRGAGTSSVRLYEALAGGRVPVIISDDWVAPIGPDWDSFSLRWPEGRVQGLVEAIEERDADWPKLSAAAAAAYRDFFAPTVAFHRIVELFSELREDGSRSLHTPRVRSTAFVSSGLTTAYRRARRAAGRARRTIINDRRG
jgi:Exostosin family